MPFPVLLTCKASPLPTRDLVKRSLGEGHEQNVQQRLF